MRENGKVGQAHRADVLQSQVAQQRQRVQVRAVENRVKTNWEGLAAMLGPCSSWPEAVAGDLEQDLPEIEWQTALRHIIEHSPQRTVAARRCLVCVEITVQRQRVQPIPTDFLGTNRATTGKST